MRARTKRPRLFWRVYVFGLMLLVGASVSFAAFVALIGERGDKRVWQEHRPHLVRAVTAHLSAVELDRADLEQRLRDVSALLDADIAVYLPDGTLVGSSGGGLRPLKEDEARGLEKRWVFHRRGGMHVAIPIQNDAQQRYVLVRRGGHKSIARFGGGILVILLAVGLISFPFARAVVRPLEKLTTTAEALGRGELGARSGVKRKDEVGRLAAALDDMAEKLQRLIESEKELLANVSHELRTPMARIRVALDLAAEDPDGARERLEGIGADLSELEQLVEDVLVTAKLDIAHRREDVAWVQVVDEAVKYFRDRHPDAGLKTEVAADLPTLTLDKMLLRRVLVNLLDNAVKYSEAHQPIELAASVAGARLHVEVRDRGIGVKEEDLDRLFEPFFRSDRSRDRGTGGVGLGLSLCRRIVEAHGGVISARLRPGGGTVFAFEIPTDRR